MFSTTELSLYGLEAQGVVISLTISAHERITPEFTDSSKSKAPPPNGSPSKKSFLTDLKEM